MPDFNSLEKKVLSFFLFICLLGGIFLGILIDSIESGYDVRQLIKFRPNLPTKLYDIKGKVISEFFLNKREIVSLKKIPPTVIITFLTVEDNNFFEHFGIDFTGILRAFWENIKAFSIVQGGSTLTQQLVKGLYTKGEKTFARKFYEAILSLEVEKQFSKKEILEMYFNQIYLGHGTYGIASAAKFYFNKNVEEVEIVEAAILAGLPKAPHAYSPFKNPYKSMKKSESILMKMAEMGYFSRTEAKKLHEKYWSKYWPKILLIPSSQNSFGERKDNAPYFTEYVRQYLEKRIDKEILYSKGYKVYTTLDLEIQKIAEKNLQKALEKADTIARESNQDFLKIVDPSLLNTYNVLKNIIPLPSIIKKYSLRNEFRQNLKNELLNAFELLTLNFPIDPINEYSKKYTKRSIEFKSDLKVQGAFIAMDHRTGRIMGMIGGREFKASDQFNRSISAMRQPGSAFKPYIYGAALEDRSIHSNMGFIDSPIYNIQPDGSMWAPSNYKGNYRGLVPLTKALSLSMNLISIQLYDLIGPEKIIHFTSKLMKVPESRFQPNPSLSLGSSEVTPMELLLGYSIIANSGKEIIPHPVLYITDPNDNVIYNFEQEILDIMQKKEKDGTLQIIEEAIAFILRKMMESVITEGTAHQAVRTIGNFQGDSAGKTGTTSSWNDAWFGGFTSDLSAMIWIGMDHGSMTLGTHQSGGSIAAPVWGKIMYEIYEKRGELPQPFTQEIPLGVKIKSVTRTSGKLPNPECKQDNIMTYVPPPVIRGEEEKKVSIQQSNCDEIQTKDLLELVKEQNEISDEELGEEKKLENQNRNNE